VSTPTVLHLTAFSDDPEGGNPAGVVVDARGLDPEHMQQLATELGYSETAFVFPLADHDDTYQLRYFSPVAEVDFCGHATIAAAVALGRTRGDGVIEFATNVGAIEVDITVAGDAVVATLTSPPARSTLLDPVVLERLLEVLDWHEDDLDPRFPAGVGMAGSAHAIVVAESRERLAELDYEFDELAELCAEQGWLTVALVHPEEGDPHARRWHARNAFPAGGVYEDAATGSAAAAFGAYLRDRGIAGSGDHITIFQGDDMGRPSSILLTLAGARMRISGTAVDL
jgi:PhzF family phenazine biosynthesis protein